jgi:hypothetical protein
VNDTHVTVLVFQGPHPIPARRSKRFDVAQEFPVV